MVTATNVQSGREVALLAAVQSAKGTPQTNFGSAPIMFSRSARIPPSPLKSSDVWMSDPVAPGPDSRFTVGKRPAGILEAHATPDLLDILLRSNWGPKSGSSYTLATKINEWFTLGWVEHGAAEDVGHVVRIQDTWFHRLILRAVFPRGILGVFGAYLGRDILPAAKGSGGLTWPATWSTEKNPFTVNDAAFVRDPAGANSEIRLLDLEIKFDQRAMPHTWDQGGLAYRVVKGGPTIVTAEFRAEVSDEAWATITDAHAGTKRAFRFTASAQSPAKSFVVNLAELDFEFDELGHEGSEMLEIHGVGRAHLSAGAPATITIA